jgi:hypothetical protein
MHSNDTNKPSERAALALISRIIIIFFGLLKRLCFKRPLDKTVDKCYTNSCNDRAVTRRKRPGRGNRLKIKERARG